MWEKCISIKHRDPAYVLGLPRGGEAYEFLIPGLTRNTAQRECSQPL